MRITLQRSVLLSALLLAGLALARNSQLGFTVSVSEKLIARFSARYGAGARAQLLEWQGFARARKTDATASRPGDAASLLGPVNGFFNRLRFVSDISHWGIEDYWATPAEAMASDGADCEDFSVAKYFMLKELGVPISKLRITYVMAKRLNQAHMVLAYYPTPDAEPLILDNLEDAVRPASERSDLVPVYSFNDDELWLAEGAKLGSSIQIRMWRDLLARLEREARI